MSQSNGAPFMDYRRPRKQVTGDAEQERIDALCRRHDLPPPDLAFKVAPGTVAVAVWAECEVAVFLDQGDTVRKTNAATCAGWRALFVSKADWASGAALALVARAARA